MRWSGFALNYDPVPKVGPFLTTSIPIKEFYWCYINFFDGYWKLCWLQVQIPPRIYKCVCKHSGSYQHKFIHPKADELLSPKFNCNHNLKRSGLINPISKVFTFCVTIFRHKLNFFISFFPYCSFSVHLTAQQQILVNRSL